MSCGNRFSSVTSSLVLLLTGLSAFSQLKAKAESEGVWCDDSPVLCSLCSHIIQQLLLLDISSGPGFAHLQALGLVKRNVCLLWILSKTICLDLVTFWF